MSRDCRASLRLREEPSRSRRIGIHYSPKPLKDQTAEERLASIANQQETWCQRMRDRHAKLSRLGFGSCSPKSLRDKVDR